MATITKDGATWTNTYNQDGMRIRRTNGTVTYGYVYNGSQLSQMTVGSNTLNFSYDANGIPMSVSYNGTTYYYATNLQGDVTAILNASGSPVVSYTYDAWGKPPTVTGSLATTLGTHNPLRYRGYVYDTETELYYTANRYYNPEIGRWINGDAFVSTGQGFIGNNMFAYCLNNPIMMTDISGNFPFFAITAAIGAVVGAVVGGVVAAANGGNVLEGVAVGAVAGGLIGTGAGIATGAALAGSITASTSAVMAGGSTLVNTVATGGLSAGTTYIANNFAQAANNFSSGTQATANKMQQVAEKGKAGEIAAGIVKNTQRIYITAARYRIPDGLDSVNKILSEVKNYSGTLSYTSQLRDFVSWSQTHGYQMHLYTNARLTGPLQRAVDSGLIQVFHLK